MKLLVFGGRGYREPLIVFSALSHIDDRFGIKALIQGGATGADAMAFKWGERILGRKRCFTENADWKDLSHHDAVIVSDRWGRKYDRRAGMRRNALMLKKYDPSHGLQFPGGPGTRGMRALLDAAGVPVFEVYSEAFDDARIPDAR